VVVISLSEQILGNSNLNQNLWRFGRSVNKKNMLQVQFPMHTKFSGFLFHFYLFFPRWKSVSGIFEIEKTDAE
jgi:hypothetical protein